MEAQKDIDRAVELGFDREELEDGFEEIKSQPQQSQSDVGSYVIIPPAKSRPAIRFPEFLDRRNLSHSMSEWAKKRFSPTDLRCW